MLNGAPTFLTLVESGAAPRTTCGSSCRPPGKTSVTGMPDAPDGAPHHYRAPDYDTLVDSPIVAGNPAIHRFVVDGKPHLPRRRRRRGRLRRRARRPRPRTHRPDRRGSSGGRCRTTSCVFFNLLGERERRAGAQELRDDDGEPLGDRHARASTRLAEPRVARILPSVERETPSPDRARAVRLRARELPAQPVDLGRPDSTTTARPAARARRPLHAAANTCASCRTPSGRCRRRRPACSRRRRWRRSTRGSSSMPPGRQHRQFDDQLLHERRGPRLRARRPHPRRDQRREEPRRRDAARLGA